MIRVTRLDGAEIYINETNIQWIEAMPDTAITFLGGARMIVRDKVDEVLARMREAVSTDQRSALSQHGASAHVGRREEGPRA